MLNGGRVTRLRDEELPVEAIRDLLGLVRALYLAERARGAGRGELERITSAGRLLQRALDLAHHPPRSIDHAAAWDHADMAVRMMGDLVSCFTRAEPVVKAATGRVRRR